MENHAANVDDGAAGCRKPKNAVTHALLLTADDGLESSGM